MNFLKGLNNIDNIIKTKWVHNMIKLNLEYMRLNYTLKKFKKNLTENNEKYKKNK